MNRADIETHTVDPQRLAAGRWCHRTGKQLGEGDIHASYSADCIGMQGRTRKPFRWQGREWVCTGIGMRRVRHCCEAYRIVPAEAFTGSAMTYTEKTHDGESARNDPLGFYHGMKVRHGGKDMVLQGPPVLLTPDAEPRQQDLFAGLQDAENQRRDRGKSGWCISIASAVTRRDTNRSDYTRDAADVLSSASSVCARFERLALFSDRCTSHPIRNASTNQLTPSHGIVASSRHAKPRTK